MGLFWPLIGRSYPLQDLQNLRIECVSEGGYWAKHSKREWYVLYLKGENRAVRIGRSLSTDYGAIRMMAEQVSRFLGRDLVDASGPETIVFPAHDLGYLLKEQGLRRESVPLPEPPGRLKYRMEGLRMIIDLPYHEYRGCLVICLFLPFAGICSLVGLYFATHVWVVVAIWGIVEFIPCFIALMLANDMMARSTVIASPELLEIVVRGTLWTSRYSHRSEEILVLRIVSNELQVISDRGKKTNIASLPPAEIQWLREALFQVLSQPSLAKTTDAR